MSKLNISRRDFLNGFALSVAAGSTLSPLEVMAQDGRYPPALTGMRGSHARRNEFDAADRAVNAQPGLS